MSFVQPLYLLGLLAAGLPIVVHLINRRKAAEQPFPALEMLMESDKKEARSIKVRRWILMALRILAVLLLVLALAKPYVYSEASVTGGGERVPKSVVFVVDDSFSMRHGDWWASAVERLERELGALKPWDKAALVTTTHRDGPVSRLVKKHDRIRRALEKLAPTQRRGDLHESLLAASDILSTSDRHREIVAIGDFTRGSAPSSASGDEIPYPVRRVSIREEGDTVRNLAVTGVSYRQKGGASGKRWTITASIHNYGDTAAEDVELQLSIGGRTVATELVDVPAGKSISHSIDHRVEGAGVRRGLVEIPDADPLALDNRRHFTFQLRENVDVLLVNGSPSSVPYRNELFFTVRALNPGEGSQSEIIPTTVTPSALADRELQNFDVVLLANVARVSKKVAGKLESFVEGGGGLFVGMGDQVETEAYNRRLGSLLPKPLRRVKRLARRNDPDAPVKITRIGASKDTHPVFQVFQLPGGASLQSIRIYKYMLLQPSPPEQSTALLSYKNGAPALLERHVGQGRVFLLTTTLDRDWTDLPVQTAFLPLLRRSILYLARRATSEDEAKHHVGQQVTLDVGGLIDDRAVVKGPDGSRTILEPRNGRIRFTPEQAGSYEVWADETKKPEHNRLDGLAFSVNLETDESDLRPLPEGTIESWLKDSNGSSPSNNGKAEADAPPQKRVNLWPALLFCVTLALLFETIVGTRRSVLKRLWRRATLREEPEIDV